MKCLTGSNSSSCNYNFYYYVPFCFVHRTLGGEIEIQKAPGGKDQKLTLSGEEAHQKRSGDEKLGMMRGLTGEMRIG